MTTNTETLPNDNEALKQLVIKLREEVAELRHNVEVFRKLALGPTSEKRKGDVVDPRQHHLFEVELVAEAQEAAKRNNVSGKVETREGKPRKKGGRRKKFPEHLPHVETTYELREDDRTCSCGAQMHPIGSETSRELERIEVTLVHTIHRTKYGCRACGESIRVAPGPFRPLERSLLGVGFMSTVIVDRFGNHMPYHRLERKYANEGLDLSRSVLERTVARCAERLSPLRDLLREQILESGVLFTDDTPVTIARPSDREEGSKKGRIWIYLDKEGRHAYDFTPDRKKDGPHDWLQGYTGFIHADAYTGYDGIFVPDGAKEVACWAHARRYFEKAESTEPELAAEILSRIRDLYKIEAVAKQEELNPTQLKAFRQDKAIPVLEDLRARIAELETSVLPKSPMGKAITYALNQWNALMVYTTDGRLEIDNNAAERALRPIAVGRKNWMFFQREGGGKNAAVLFSLLRSAEAAGVNPVDYFRDVLVRIDDETDWKKLLPHAWKEHFAGEAAKRREDAVRALNFAR